MISPASRELSGKYFKLFAVSGIYMGVRSITNLLRMVSPLWPGTRCFRALAIQGAIFLSLVSLSAQAAHTQARLVLATETARPGETIMAAVHLHMEPGWHTYWKNPGASGTASEINWQLPKGVSAGEIQWPVPEKLPDTNATTYIYEGDLFLLVPLKLAANLSPGPLDLQAKVAWLECEMKCIPGKADLRGVLTVANETKPSKE